MIELTNEMGEQINPALANRVPCILATASPGGVPSIGYRGSMMVFDGQHLAYWERTRGTELANIEANPRVEVLYRDHATRIGWKFHGVARIYKEGPIRDQVMAKVVERELAQDAERKGYAVVIRVDKVTNMIGQVQQQREEGQRSGFVP